MHMHKDAQLGMQQLREFVQVQVIVGRQKLLQ